MKYLTLLAVAAVIVAHFKGCTGEITPLEVEEPSPTKTVTLKSLDKKWDGSNFKMKAVAEPPQEESNPDSLGVNGNPDSLGTNLLEEMHHEDTAIDYPTLDSEPPANTGETRNSPKRKANHLTTPPQNATVINVRTTSEWINLQRAIDSSSNFVKIIVKGSHSTKELQINPRGKTVQIIGDNASFNGQKGNGYWLNFYGTGGGRLEVSNVTVNNYSNGVRLSGGYLYKGVNKAVGEGKAMSGVIQNSIFSNIGSAYGGGAGYAAVHLQNTNGVLVLGNTFKNNINYDKPGNIHSVYLVLSKNIKILDNSFTNISGDPVRLRNNCTGVLVNGNVFTKAGSYGYISDWYCNSSCQARTGQGAEYPSPRPSIASNTYNGGYRGWIGEWAVTS